MRGAWGRCLEEVIGLGDIEQDFQLVNRARWWDRGRMGKQLNCKLLLDASSTTTLEHKPSRIFKMKITEWTSRSLKVCLVQ